MVYDAIRAHGSFDVGLPPGPNFFSYGEPAYAHDLFARARFAIISTKEVSAVWRVSSPDGIYEAMSAASCVRRQSSTSNVRKRCRRSDWLFGKGFTVRKQGPYEVPAPALVVTAQKIA